jgi:anti-anti-sigma regulatory factor
MRGPESAPPRRPQRILRANVALEGVAAASATDARRGDVIQVSELSGTVVLKPTGERLDVEIAPQFRATLHELIRSGHRHFVVDLGGVTFIDSSGLGALISGLKMLKTSKDRRRQPRPEPPRRPARRGDIRLANVQAPVVSLLEIIRLHKVFATHDSVEQAVQSFS